MGIELKTCNKCGVQKQLSEFYSHRDCKDGVRPQCIKCTAEYAKENKERVNANNKKSRKKNKEKIKLWHAENYKRNKEKIDARVSLWQSENRERRYARNSEWKSENPEKIRIYNHSRRSAISDNLLSNDIVQGLLIIQGRKCVYCKIELDSGYHMDHVMPLALGGKNEDWNLQLLCPSCNLKKGSKHPVQFMLSIGMS